MLAAPRLDPSRAPAAVAWMDVSSGISFSSALHLLHLQAVSSLFIFIFFFSTDSEQLGRSRSGPCCLDPLFGRISSCERH